MSGTRLQLMEELLQSIEQRDAGDPDAPAWEASARIERLEAELARRLGTGDADPRAADSIVPQSRSDEVAAAV